MKAFASLTHIAFLCSFYCASLCLLSLSWAEDVIIPSSAKQAGDVSLQSDNVTSTNISEKQTFKSANSVVVDSEIRSSAVVQSSFEEITSDNAKAFSQADFAFVDTASQNSGVFNEITDTSQGVVFTLADVATAELQQRADIPSAVTSHNETPNLAVQSNSSGDPPTLTAVHLGAVEFQVENGSEEIALTQQTEKIADAVAADEPKENNATDGNEDIPSFSEWAQKQLEEAEKKKELVNTSSQTVNVNGKSNSNLKVRSKNYASPDCGAKIVAANPEAGSANAVLSPSRDEYMLNACTNRIWFVVELCEAIQAKKIDLANFELFSSSPRDLSVYVSDRFPSREWSNVGQFAAKDERDVQSFDLHPHLFGKFVKVEMHSHHGSEHFCPISSFRVYGTSEFEALEKEDRGHGSAADDEDDDETLDSDSGEPPRNLFSSATDAVISIVKKAAEVLGNKGNHSNQTNEQDRTNAMRSSSLNNTCSTPSHLIVCDNCSDVLFGSVYDLLSCRSSQIYDLVRLKLIKRCLSNTDTCREFGLDFRAKRISTTTGVYSAYVKSFFSRTYLAAMCNALAVTENKVVLNVSKQFPNVTKEAPGDIHVVETLQAQTVPAELTKPSTEAIKATEELTLDRIELATSIPVDATNISDASEINPTKTYTPENDLNTHVSAENKDDIRTAQLSDVQDATNATHDPDVDLELAAENLGEFEVTTESSENMDLDLMSELNSFGSTSNPNTATVPNATPQAKESVFLRLSNRIKALERNMSLSSQYLEELSRRYKKQVEEMQKLLDKTLNSLTEESKKRDDHNRRLEQQLSDLSTVVNALVMEKNNWVATTYWLFLTMIVVFGILVFCRRAEHKRAGVDSSGVSVQRRKSIAVVNHNAPVKKERRPSEEALKITGTYKELLIDDADSKKKYKERKKRKKKQTLLHRSNSISMLLEEDAENDACPRATASDVIVQLGSNSAMAWSRQESAPAKFEWDANSVAKSRMEEIPFVLEESDNSPLQSLPIPCTLQSLPSSRTNGDVPLKDLTPPPFMKTAGDSRNKRNGSVKSGGGEKNGYEGGHKKSASVDDTPRRHSPAPSSGATSLNVDFDDVKGGTTSRKKEKKGGGIKRIFRKVF